MITEAEPTEPTVPAAGPSAAPVLRWGIKRSFINYLSRLPDGSVSADSGASIVSGSFFQFEPDGRGDGPPAEPDVLKFRGEVRLSGHHGMMSLSVADPWIEFTAGGAVLSIVDPEQGPGGSGRVALLRLAAGGAPGIPGTDWNEVPARLAPGAVGLFNGQYDAGEDMDAVFLVFPASPE